MLTYAGLFSENRNESNPIRRFAYVKKFFSAFKIAKIVEYCGIDTTEVSKIQKATEKAFSVPDFLVSTMNLCNSDTSYWKRVQSSLSVIGSGTNSLLWLNSVVSEYSKPLLTGMVAEAVETISTCTKILDASWRTARSVVKIFDSSKVQGKTSRHHEKIIALSLSLLNNILKLFLAILSVLAVLAGVILSPVFLLIFYVITLGLSIVTRFINKNICEAPQKDVWRRLAWL